MRYAGLIKNDTAAAPGMCVTFFVQGCPLRCPGCHNKDSWDYDGGMEFTPKVLEEIIEALTANGINRNLCIMGGEPLCEDNAFLTHMVIQEVRKKVPGVKVYIWSGYVYEDLLRSTNPHVRGALELADVLIDGPYIAAERDLTLNMRGSRNQRVIDLHKKN
jgi:anaerobic ribonucleoside-triphosphate reductase activating protein